MCGIVTIFQIKDPKEEVKKVVLECAKKIRHRGPDWSGYYQDDNFAVGHERLAIVDPKSGRQPLISQDGRYVLAVNGEIYNHQELKKELTTPYPFQTESDCEVLIPLYMEFGTDFIQKLNGIFGFVLYDKAKNEIVVGRDHMGIIPLYHGWDVSGQYFVASELKSLEGNCKTIEVFQPGTLYHSHTGFQTWYQPNWTDFRHVKANTTSLPKLRESLEQAVYRQLMSDVPYGVLLSGGLDSSIIAALAQKYSEKRIESGSVEKAWWPRLHSFAIGLQGSPDLAASRKVADAIGTVHHEINFTVEEGINSLRDVIYHLETYDVTTVRASTPMYLLARVIKSMGIKMVLSGEGADEIFGGYLYFHKAPNAQAFHEENVRKLGKLYQYDCLRANKSLAAWGIEGRVPFLDKEFMDVAMTLNPADKMVTPAQPIEKFVLRKAFEGLIPDEILWRQKEQFSDGVGYSWIDSLKELVAREVSDDAMSMAKFRFPIHTPMTKEEYYYRTIFEELFPSESAARTVPSVPSVACSSPVALEWDESFKKANDPSGRAVNVHQQRL
ncbi:MAG: asparagine synthase B [Saprospiraceae bacterium]|nr:asparagine synthase B [Saprospiraceae bacterium]